VAVPVSANIAEGFRKQSKQNKIRVLNISEGSAIQTLNF
jgi:four helix bundle protein